MGFDQTNGLIIPRALRCARAAQKKLAPAPSRPKKEQPRLRHTISCVFDTANAQNDEIACLMKADDKTLTEGKLLNWCFAFPRFALKTKGSTISYYLGESAIFLAQTSEIAWIPTNHGTYPPSFRIK